VLDLYIYNHSTDSLPFDFQAYTDLINSERPGLFGRGGLSGGIRGNGTSLDEVTPARFTSSPV